MNAGQSTVGADLVADRVAIVTGGAQGIGRATVTTLLANGARVCVADIDGELAQEIVAEWGSERVLVVPGDLARPSAAAELVAAAFEAFGEVDILVNNAGYFWDARIHDMTDEQFEAMLQIHTVVPFRLTREVLTRWRPIVKREADSGIPRYRKVVNVSSRAGLAGVAGGANYAAGKAGLLGLTYSAAKECGHLNINVNAVAFGPVRTRFGHPVSDGTVLCTGGHHVPLGRRASPSAGPGPADIAADTPPPAPSKPRRKTISGRSATPQEAADVILFLCSSLSNMVNGQVLLVNG